MLRGVYKFWAIAPLIKTKPWWNNIIWDDITAGCEFPIEWNWKFEKIHNLFYSRLFYIYLTYVDLIGTFSKEYEYLMKQ